MTLLRKRGYALRDGYCLFWKSWLSNWHPSPFTLDGVTYGCVEQWMMAEKARTFCDDSALSQIMATANPSEQQRLGRTIKYYDDAVWGKLRYVAVLKGTLEKYRQNAWLRYKLLSLGSCIFVEASPHDLIWGIGARASDPSATSPALWRGQNLLGYVITDARNMLRREYPLMSFLDKYALWTTFMVALLVGTTIYMADRHNTACERACAPDAVTDRRNMYVAGCASPSGTVWRPLP